MPATPPSPWDIDYFNPPTPDIKAPAPKVKTPKLVPEVDDLFQVQRNALKALNALDDFEAKKGDKDTRALRRDLENAYRVIRSYLEKYAS